MRHDTNKKQKVFYKHLCNFHDTPGTFKASGAQRVFKAYSRSRSTESQESRPCPSDFKAHALGSQNCLYLASDYFLPGFTLSASSHLSSQQSYEAAIIITTVLQTNEKWGSERSSVIGPRSLNLLSSFSNL